MDRETRGCDVMRKGRAALPRGRHSDHLLGGPSRLLAVPAVLALGLALTAVGCKLFSHPGRPSYERLTGKGQALWDRARAARAAGDLDGARGRLARLADLEPGFFRGLREWQDTLIEAGRDDEAAGCASSVSPGSASALVLEARTEQDPERAEALLRRAVAADPDLAWAWLGLGFVQRKHGDLLSARRSLRRAVEAYPQFPEGLHDLAMLEYELGEPREARSLLERYLAERPGDRPARHVLASLLATVLLDYDRSEEEYRILVAQDDQDVAALLGLAGVVALGEEDYEEAESLYKHVLQLDNSAVDALYNLGWLYETRMNRPREALDEYRRYLEYDGPGADPRSLLYVIYFVPNRVAQLEERLGEAPGKREIKR